MISKTAVLRETERRVRRMNVRTGEGLLRLRLDAGVSLRELASATGLHPSFLARIEAAKVQPSVPMLTRIGIALGADLSLRFLRVADPGSTTARVEQHAEQLDDQEHGRWVSPQSGGERPAVGGSALTAPVRRRLKSIDPG